MHSYLPPWWVEIQKSPLTTRRLQAQRLRRSIFFASLTFWCKPDQLTPLEAPYFRAQQPASHRQLFPPVGCSSHVGVTGGLLRQPGRPPSRSFCGRSLGRVYGGAGRVLQLVVRRRHRRRHVRPQHLRQRVFFSFATRTGTTNTAAAAAAVFAGCHRFRSLRCSWARRRDSPPPGGSRAGRQGGGCAARPDLGAGCPRSVGGRRRRR